MGKATFANKPARIKEIVSSITDILMSKKMTPPMARSLRGRLQFAGSQTFGKCAAAPIRTLGQVADSHRYQAELSEVTQFALRWFREYFRDAAPRTLTLHAGPPVVVFTDGFCEPGEDGAVVAGVGAVLFHPNLPEPEYFGEKVPPDLMALWTGDREKSQVVGQAELLPVCMAKELWAKHLAGRAVIYFIDNDAARYGLIAGSSRVPASSMLIFDAWQTDAVTASMSWYARVPTKSNVSDGPSRLDFTHLLSLWPRSTARTPAFPSARDLIDSWVE